MILPQSHLSEMVKVAILTRSKLNWSWKLEPEQRLTIEMADELRALSLQGTLKGVWFHVPNEGKRHPIVGCIMRAMGMHSGIHDFAFLWDTGSATAEVKVGKAKPTENQSNVAKWCQAEGVHTAVWRSVEDMRTSLHEWGVIH
jgi:hypothetical protein